MEDQELYVDPNYLKGFNSGYNLAKEEPALLEQLIQSKNEHNQYFQGMKAGGKEYLKEKFKEDFQRDREQKDRSKSKEREKE